MSSSSNKQQGKEENKLEWGIQNAIRIKWWKVNFLNPHTFSKVLKEMQGLKVTDGKWRAGFSTR